MLEFVFPTAAENEGKGEILPQKKNKQTHKYVFFMGEQS